MNQNEMGNLYRGPSIDDSYQVSQHLAKRFQRKSCFRNRPIRNMNCLWWPCDQNGMSNSHRKPSIYASYHVSVHQAKRFQRRLLGIDQLEKNNCLCRLYLLMDRDEISNRHRGPDIDAPNEVSVHLAKWFQRRIVFRIQ